MTNKEAIEELKKVDTLDMPARLCEAHYMAIKALEQELCNTDTCKVVKAFMNGWDKPKNSDAISRQAVLDITWEEPSYTDALNVLTEVRDKVKSLPSVNPQEPKTGHWIRMKTYEKWGCSECNTVFRFTFKEHDYCPNCGSAMKGE